MTYKILAHTADARISLLGKNLKEIFFSALLGMNEILGPEFKNNAETIIRHIKVNSQDKTALLIDFLNECLYLSEIKGEIYEKINITHLNEKSIRVELMGKKIKRIKKNIKAATYHEADIIKNKNGLWQTFVVFDI